jgi:hypothetical protein
MRTCQRCVLRLNVLAVFVALVYQSVCGAGQTDALAQRVGSQDVAAIKEAGNQSRSDLIPSLEGAANMSADPDEPVRIWAKAALAKLGAKKYLDETVSELTTTNSDLFTFYIGKGICAERSQETRVQCAKQRTWETAFKKLAYIRDPSTVKIVAQFLYSTEHFQFSTDVPPWTASGFAIFTLRQMVDNPPQTPVEYTHEQDVHAWQQWWEQNKDKYP